MPGLDGKMSNMTEDDLLRNGLGTGYGMGRVLERDGVLHGRMGPWREVGTVSRMDTENRNAVRESRVGLAL